MVVVQLLAVLVMELGAADRPQSRDHPSPSSWPTNKRRFMQLKVERFEKRGEREKWQQLQH
jgi:hypothetical protein